MPPLNIPRFSSGLCDNSNGLLWNATDVNLYAERVVEFCSKTIDV